MGKWSLNTKDQIDTPTVSWYPESSRYNFSSIDSIVLEIFGSQVWYIQAQQKNYL